TLRFHGDFNAKRGSPVEGRGRAVGGLREACPWPGNVRELRNVIERAVIVARDGLLEPAHLPPFLRSREAGSDSVVVVPIGTTVADAERELILKTLAHVGHNKAEAARQLGLDVKTIRNKLRAWGEA